jgi:hypothetical protein
MQPRQPVQARVKAFNRADAPAEFHVHDAVNHQVAESPARGRGAIRRMFPAGFASAKMVCVEEDAFEDGEWAILGVARSPGLSVSVGSSTLFAGGSCFSAAAGTSSPSFARKGCLCQKNPQDDTGLRPLTRTAEPDRRAPSPSPALHG